MAVRALTNDKAPLAARTEHNIGSICSNDLCCNPNEAHLTMHTTTSYQSPGALQSHPSGSLCSKRHQAPLLLSMLVQLPLSAAPCLATSVYRAALLGHCWKQGVEKASSCCWGSGVLPKANLRQQQDSNASVRELGSRSSTPNHAIVQHFTKAAL